MNKSIKIVLAIAAILRVGFIWIAPFWYDESFTLLLVRLPFNQMLAAIAGDVHPPLYYVLLWPIGQLLNITSLPIWILRIPSAIFSILAVWFFWKVLLVYEPKEKTRFTALILMAIMPIGLAYAQEARMYALLEFLVVTGFYLILTKKWGWFTLVSIALVYTQNYGLFYVATLSIVGLILDYSEWWNIVFFSGLKTIAAYLFWVPFLIRQMKSISGVHWIHLDEGGTILPTIFRLLFMPDNNSVIQIPLMLAGFGWLFAAIFYLIFNKNYFMLNKKGYVITLLLLAFFPMVLAIIISILFQPVLLFRPLIGCAPFLYWILAGPIEYLFDYDFITNDITLKRIPALFAACWIVPLVLIVDGMILGYEVKNKSFNGIQKDLTYIRENWQPGDIVLNNGDDAYVSLAPYAPEIPQYRVEDCSAGIGGLSDTTRKALGVKSVTPDLAYKRAWVIWEYTPLSRVERSCVADLYGLDLNHPTYGGLNNEYIDIGIWLIERDK
jgi:hypothetical protein